MLNRQAICLFLLMVAMVRLAAQDLPVATPESQGVDTRRLVTLTRQIRTSKEAIHSFLIARNGRLVYEVYGSGLGTNYNFNTFSVTKSFLGAMIGLAIQEGKLTGVDQTMDSVLPAALTEGAQSKGSITLRHLLTMHSGIHETPNFGAWLEDNRKFTAMSVRTPYAVQRPRSLAPGQKFIYTDYDAHLAGAMLHHATGMRFSQYLEAKLFKPMGFTKYRWMYRDKAGVDIGGYGLRIRSRDMIKFGQLILNQGKWNGKQLVPAAWLSESTQRQVETGDGWYGYYWWQYGLRLPAYSAVGMYGQFITIIPSANAVVVMTATIPDERKNDVYKGLINRHVIPSFYRGRLRDNPSSHRSLAAETKKLREGPNRFKKLPNFQRPSLQGTK